MRKDKEWLKREIYAEYNDSDFIQEVWGLIDQLDEPEVTLDKAFEKVAESYLMTKEEIWRHLERLVAHGGKVTYGEPEVLSQEWVREHTWNNHYIGRPFVYVEDLQNLLVPKQDKPIIPQFVADWIEKWKREELILRDWSRFNLDDENEYEVAEWLYDNDDDEINILRKFTLIDAIRYGYEVEKDKLYRIKFSENQYASRFNDGKINSVLTDEELAAQYTEAEIKAIDKRFWAFAEEV